MFRGMVALMRPKHWIKNGLIFVPLVFSGELFDWQKQLLLVGAFVVFSLSASLVYIVNDARDIDRDKLHPKKKLRPLASGVVPLWAAWTLAGALVVACVAIGFALHLPLMAWILLLLYLAINVSYSFGLKNIPVVDIAILSAGFLIRVLFGAEVVDISVSSWLYMTVLAGALYLGLGKRRNEIQSNGVKSRKVSKYYSIAFLDKNMYVSLALLFVFYSLWATDPARNNPYMFITIPLVIFTFMTYSLSVEKDTSSGDPVDVLVDNKPLLALAFISIATMVLLVYVV